MQALILAGGEGSRLRPLTLNTPKPIVPIGNQPFLLRQLNLLKNAGVTDVTLSLGYQPTAIKEALGDGSEYGVRLRYLVEPAPLGTAGAYKYAEEFLKSATLVLNGDILTDIDLRAVAEHHKKYAAAATIVLTEVENPAVYGMVEKGRDNEVLRFLEKPKPDEITGAGVKTINAGIYILEPQILNSIPAGEIHSFEYQVFPGLLREKANFRAFVANENYWLDIGTPERYLQAHHDLLAGKIKNLQIHKNSDCKMPEAAEVDNLSIIDSGCMIGRGAKIINSVLGKNVVVEEDSVVRNSVIWAGTRVGQQASVFNSIIGCNCRIGRKVKVAEGAVWGDNTIIADFTDC